MFSVLGRRRATPLINEETEDGGGAASGKKPTSLQLCAQFSLICSCIVILFFGLSVTAVGFWGYHTERDYLSITANDPELTRLPFSMMVTGVFVSILGLVGVFGSIFSRTITGQTLLGVFSFVLVLVIISEVGAGAAAIKLKYDLKAVFIEKAAISQSRYGQDPSTTQSWDAFQVEHECCGANGFVGDETPYYKVFNNESVPLSCCSCRNENENNEPCDSCETYVTNATHYWEYIFNAGCPSKVVGKVTERVMVIAVIAIVIGTTQLLAVFLAVVVAYMSSKVDQEKGSYSYNKLLQQDESSQAVAS